MSLGSRLFLIATYSYKARFDSGFVALLHTSWSIFTALELIAVV